MSGISYSASYRIFAFLAVGCCVAAVSWAIRDPMVAAIGIPGLAMGHFYSWRRSEASAARTLILLLFMVLTVFLGGDILLSGLSDRLLLSRYLIYGLVIGSFDLMRVRNVIASILLGALLLILISELALSLWFLAFLAGYTVLTLFAVAIARIDVLSEKTEIVGGFSWFTAGKYWLGFAFSALLISSVFFMMMPRLASSQVARASWIPSRLDLSIGRLVLLPDKPGVSVEEGILPSLFDRDFGSDGYYASLGYTGSAADKPVMYVRSRISSYWRGLTLDVYDGRGWLSSSPQLILNNESRQEYVFPDSKFRESEEKQYWQVYYLLVDQPNAVFTGYWPGKIYLLQEMRGFLESGTLYRALSLVPNLRPEFLRSDRVVRDDARNLTLPLMSERTTVLAQSIVAGASSDYDKAARLERFLLENYSYNLDVEPLPPGRDAADYFLFEQQTGYCSHFATTMAVMARQVGLPARVAVGYLPGFIDPLTGAHVVRAGDAHAWVEINFEEHGWVAFDPTPRPDAAMGFASGRNWVYFGFEDITGIKFASILSPIMGKLSLGPLSIPSWLWLVVVLAVALIVLLRLSRNRRKSIKKPRRRQYSALDGEARQSMLKLYAKAVSALTKKGLPMRQPYQPPAEYAVIVCEYLPEIRENMNWLTLAVSSAAYNPEPFHSSVVLEAKRRLSELRKILPRKITRS